MPETPSGSSAEPTLYHSICTTTGARLSSMTTTSIPLSSVYVVTSSACAAIADIMIANAANKRVMSTLFSNDCPDTYAALRFDQVTIRGCEVWLLRFCRFVGFTNAAQAPIG